MFDLVYKCITQEHLALMKQIQGNFSPQRTVVAILAVNEATWRAEKT